jgi:hypothetical protein
MALGGTATIARCGCSLNEVLADPATDWDGNGSVSSRDDEWVELYNPGPGEQDLNGFVIGDGDGTPLMALAGSLAGGGHRLVLGGEAAAFQSAHGWSVFGLRLGNDGDTVTLLQVVGTDTLLVDSYSYGNHEAEDDRSSGRRPDGSAVWELFDGLNPYTGQTLPLGNGLVPTPGQANGEPGVAVVPSSWGRIRALYR